MEKINFTAINTDLKELTVWKLLFYTLKCNVMESANKISKMNKMENTYSIDWISETTEEIIKLKRSLEEELNKMPSEIRRYPCPYILLYQSYFLDKVYI